MKENGGLGDVLRVMLGLPGVDGVEDVGILFVYRDFQARPLVLLLVGHPLAGLHPVLGGHVHLGPVDPVHAGADLELPGHETLRITQAPEITEHDAHVDAVGAEGAAAVAAGALGPGHVHAVAHVLVGDVAVLLDDFPQGGLNLISRHLGGVPAVGQVKKAGVGAIPAMGAHFQPGAQAGFQGRFEGVLQLLHINVDVLHFLVVFTAAGVAEERIELLFGIDRYFIAENSFGHVLAPLCKTWLPVVA